MGEDGLKRRPHNLYSRLSDCLYGDELKWFAHFYTLSGEERRPGFLIRIKIQDPRIFCGEYRAKFFALHSREKK